MNSLFQLFKANLKIFYRNKQGFFWTLAMPAGIYTILSVLPISKGVDGKNSYTNFILPGIIAMTIMQTGIYGLAYWMVDLRARGVIKRFLATPLNISQFIMGILGARLVVIFIEVIVLTALGVLAFHASFAGNFFSTFLFTLLGGGIFLLLGLLISNYANSYETAAPITTAVGLPLTFLGNIFFPIDGLPKVLKAIAEILPITYLSDGLRQSYLYAFDFNKIGKDLVILIVWFIFMLALTLWLFKLKED